MGAIQYTTSIIVLLLSAFIYSRWEALRLFYVNSPARLAAVNNVGEYEIKFRNVLRNCEDIYLNEEQGWALLSCDPGRDKWNTVTGVLEDPTTPSNTGIYLYRYSEGDDAAPAKVQLLEAPDGHDKDFHPLGIEYEETGQILYVINHAPNGPRVEWFRLDVAQNIATYGGSVKNATSLRAPNSMAAVNEHSVFITNDHFLSADISPILAMVETYTALPGGSVAFLKRSEDGSTLVKTLLRVPFANGIVLLNSTTLAVASSNTARVRIFSIAWTADGMPELTQISSISVPFMPDNLSLDSKGNLLIGGHPHAPSLEKIAKNNRFCQDPASAAGGGKCDFIKSSWIVEWNEEAGLRTLYAGSDFGTSAGAVRDWRVGVGFAVGLYEQGVLAWKA